MPDVVAAVPTPALRSSRYCTAAPVAGPPGSNRLEALPASCEVITGNQALVRRARRCRAQRKAKATTWAPAVRANQCSSMVDSWSQDENTSSTLGPTKYSDTPVTSKNPLRLRIRRVRPLRSPSASPNRRPATGRGSPPGHPDTLRSVIALTRWLGVAIVRLVASSLPAALPRPGRCAPARPSASTCVSCTTPGWSTSLPG